MCKMIVPVICSYNTASFRFDQFYFVSRKDGVQKPSSKDGFLSVFNTLALPAKKQSKGTYTETHGPYKVLFALEHYNNDEFKIATIHLS